MDDQLEKWTQKWDKALQDGIFDDAPKPVISRQNQADDFFGNHRPQNTDIKDVDARYWQNVYRLSSDQGDAPDPLVAAGVTDDLVACNEDAPVGKDQGFTPVEVTKKDNKSSKSITDDLGRLPQHVRPETREQDSRSRVTPNWAGGDDLIELHNMKANLEKLESKLNGAEGMGESKKAKTIQTQIDSLKKKIDDLSNSLSPDFTTDYLS